MDTLKINEQDIIGLLDQLHQAVIPTDVVAAIKTLADSGSRAAIPSLIEGLNHHHPSVSAAAVEGLLQLATDSVEPLMAAFHASGDHGVQAYIVQTLAQIADERATDLLVEVVGVEVANHCQGNVRRVAARGLGKIAHTSSNPQVIRAAVEKLTWALLNAEDWALRYATVVSLQEIGTSEARAVLERSLSQERDKAVQARLSTALEVLQPR